jgi:hypothetical protein
MAHPALMLRPVFAPPRFAGDGVPESFADFMRFSLCDAATPLREHGID